MNSSSKFDEESREVKDSLHDDHKTNALDDESEAFEHDLRLVVVARMEIMNSQYDNFYLKFIFYFSTFVVGFAYMLDSTTRYYYTNYATGALGNNSLLSTVNVLTAIIGAAGQIVFARMSDIFGRIEMYVVSVLFYVVGTIIQCQATNIAKYATGAVFYNLGFVGLVLILVLILSDFSSMRWRLFAILCPTFSYIIITWISGNVVSAVGPEANWKWGIGMWAFIFPLANIPFMICIGHMWIKARKTQDWIDLNGVRRKFVKKKGYMSFLIELCLELDLVGALLMTVSLGCILAPLTLAGGYESKWQQGSIIAPIVVGVVLVPVFYCWERFVSKFPLTPMSFYNDRAIYCPLLISFTFMFISLLVSEYLYNVLTVSVNQSIESATRILSLSSFTAEISGFFYALVLVEIKRPQPFLVFGTLMWMLSLGLMYHFRSGMDAKAGIIAAEVVQGFGTGFFSYAITVIMQSRVPHEQLASVTAWGYVLYRVGGAVGSSVGGAIWTQILYKRLLTLLSPEDAELCFLEPQTFILNYTWGTSERMAAVEGYRHIQRILTLVGLVFCVPLILFAVFTTNIKLKAKVANVEFDKDGNVVEVQDDNEAFSLVQWFKNKYNKGST